MRAAPLRGQPDAFIVDVTTKAHPTRSFVSPDRVHDALRNQLGCLPTGTHGPDGTYWVTPRGAPFEVPHPIADPAAAPVMRPDGTSQLCYSYRYAKTLLLHVIDLCSSSRSRAVDRTPRDRSRQRVAWLPEASRFHQI
jgi:hypothetical protein